jgi:hypothetical protein
MSPFRCLFVAAAVSLTGCAATVVKSGPDAAAQIHVPPAAASRLMLSVTGSEAAMKSSDWTDFRVAFRGAVAAEAAAADLPFSMQPGEPQPGGQDGTLLAVYVNDYHYVSTGARIGLGIFTGNAFVDAKVRFLDAKTGQSYGEQHINTSSSAWQGVFSAMTDKQLQAIAKEIVEDVKPH